MDHRYGKFLYSSGNIFWRFENEFLLLEIEYKNNKYLLKVNDSYKIDKDLQELLGLKITNQEITKEKAEDIILKLKEYSLSINEYREQFHRISAAPFTSMRQQYLKYHYFILIQPLRILVKFKEYLKSKNVKYNFWHRWFNINYFEKLIEETENRITELKHSVNIDYYYRRYERMLYPWC